MDFAPEILSSAKQLSLSVYLIEPSGPSRRATSPQGYSTSPERREGDRLAIQRRNSLPSPPRTIILSAWPSASASQLNRYVTGYRTLYPGAQILLLTISPTDTFLRTSTLHEQLLPAIHALAPRYCTSSTNPTNSQSPPPSPPLSNSTSPARRRSTSSTKRTSSPSTRDGNIPGTVLLHLFGTPSAARACTLLRLYRTHYGAPLPLKAIVLDTAPSSSALSLHDPRAMIQEAARLRQRPLRTSIADSGAALASWVVGFVVALLAWLIQTLWLGGEAEEERVRQELNDEGGLVPKGVRRCYIFPGQEMLFSWKENGGGGNGGAREKGEMRGCEDVRRQWKVKREKVGREGWSGDEERFWEGVEALWEGRED